ncbi:uncharacterized protein GIQ15_01964 [Arthroderma uncinatum]|uniref:uncharacterized protein n=1 Tax=Arthroderma uncinatum TaxID=74035 RepID=UPI00144AAB96|nr:uncharacterized protein GIQ15_01964 [Arthroderma uncinatum]KAF3482640.1 hypothetical protein GIQ15_01964 [Arthroderma uncinatum]
MAAKAFGKRLCEEVENDGLDSILRDVKRRCASDPKGHVPTSPVGIKVIDDMLRIFHRPPAPRPGVPDRHKVLEITGSRYGSGAGKTSLLYYIISIGILPASFNGVQIGGRDGAVVFLDSDNRFNAARLRDIAMNYVREKKRKKDTGSPPREKRQREDETELRKMVEGCLQHVHVFKPTSSDSLLATLQSMESYLLDTTKHHSAHKRLHSIMIDSTSSFYWQDKRQAFIDSLPTEVPKYIYGDLPPLREIVHSARGIVKCLRELQHRFACPVIYTVTGRIRGDLWKPKPSGFGAPIESLYARPKVMSFMHHLPHPWRSYSTVRLVVRRDRVRRFSAVSVREAMHQARQRQFVVAQGRFSAWIDPWGKEDWPSWISPSIQKLEGGGRFTYFVHSLGVTLKE